MPKEVVDTVEVEPRQPLPRSSPIVPVAPVRITWRTLRRGAKRGPRRGSTNPIDSRRRGTSVLPIVSPRISTAPRLRELNRSASVSQSRLAGAVRAEQSPALA